MSDMKFPNYKMMSDIKILRIENLKKRSFSQLFIDYLIGRRNEDLEIFVHGEYLQRTPQSLQITGDRHIGSLTKEKAVTMKKFFSLGIDVDRKDDDGLFPLLILCHYKGALPIIKYLIEKKNADPHLFFRDLSLMDYNLKLGNSRIVKYLFEQNVRPTTEKYFLRLEKKCG
eukprot:UN02009